MPGRRTWSLCQAAPAERGGSALGPRGLRARLLLLVIWGPAPATRQLGYIIAYAVLLTLGVHSLRRQTASEFPNAHAGDTMGSIRSWYAGRGHPATPASVAAGGNGGRIAELERLARLHDSGALTDAEFSAEKTVLSNSS
jgi:putative oligomerization/nucleic acid binding protein